MSRLDGQHDGKLHLWGIHSDQATWDSTVDRQACEGGQRVFCMSSQVQWRCAPCVLPLELRTVLPGHDQQIRDGQYSSTLPTVPDCNFMPYGLQEVPVNRRAAEPPFLTCIRGCIQPRRREPHKLPDASLWWLWDAGDGQCVGRVIRNTSTAAGGMQHTCVLRTMRGLPIAQMRQVELSMALHLCSWVRSCL